VNRIVFENASIREGDAGEVIVNFHNHGVSDEAMRNFSMLNGKTRLSSWINGGGSPGGDSGVETSGGENRLGIGTLRNMQTSKAPSPTGSV